MFLLPGIQGGSHRGHTEVVGRLTHRPWPLYHHSELLRPDQSLDQKETSPHVIHWAKMSFKLIKWNFRASASLPHLLPTCLVDMTPPTLHLYGSGALDALDTPPQDTKPVTALHFHCIEFSEVVSWLGKIPRAFPDLNVSTTNVLLNLSPSLPLSFHQSVCFECTNLTTLDQINFLSSLPSPLLSLTITPHGNPLTSHPLFTHYTLYRLQHLQLSTFNEKEITKEDLTAASRVFHCLGKLSTTQLQPARLASFVLHHRYTHTHSIPPSESLPPPPPSLSLPPQTKEHPSRK